MEKFYCNVCNCDVTLKNGICPKCETNWQNIIEESLNSKNTFQKYVKQINEEEKVEEVEEKIDDIAKTITFFLKYAQAVKIGTFILAIIVAIGCLILVDDSEGLSLIFLILVCPLIVFWGIFLEQHFKWKAYMLKINYESK